MSHIGIKSLRSRDHEKHRPQDHQAEQAIVEQEADTVHSGRDRAQHLRAPSTMLPMPKRSQDHKPSSMTGPNSAPIVKSAGLKGRTGPKRMTTAIGTT